MSYLLLFALVLPQSPQANLDPAAIQIIEDARDGELEDFNLLEAAITLSEIGEGEKKHALARFEQLVTMAKSGQNEAENGVLRARRFVSILHTELFQAQFDPECEDLKPALMHGKHNCVVSLIFTLEYCRRLGILAHAMQQENHVWLRVTEQGGGDVETTRLTIQPAMIANGRRLTDAQLLSRLIYNQARRRHNESHFEEATQRLEWCLQIDPAFESAERNLRIVLGNWTAAAAATGRFSEALAVNEKAIARFPADDSLTKNASFLKQEWQKWRATSPEPQARQ